MKSDLRGTGRTTRMLEDAQRLSCLGRCVYVVALDKRHADQLRSMLPKDTRVNVEEPWQLGNVDWLTMTLRGAAPNVVMLVDHHTIEHMFHPMLDMLNRYDKGDTE